MKEHSYMMIKRSTTPSVDGQMDRKTQCDCSNHLPTCVASVNVNNHDNFLVLFSIAAISYMSVIT